MFMWQLRSEIKWMLMFERGNGQLVFGPTEIRCTIRMRKESNYTRKNQQSPRQVQRGKLIFVVVLSASRCWKNCRDLFFFCVYLL